MMLKLNAALPVACLLVSVAVVVAGSSALRPSHAHEGHVTFSAGEPGNPKQRSRTITMKMRSEGDTMMFTPARIEVRRGEQIRFVLQNDEDESHEFILATVAENKKHAEEMKKFPEMEHDDPNGKRVGAYRDAEILWKFSKRGEFEYACLIPGHYEAGMVGKVIVK